MAEPVVAVEAVPVGGGLILPDHDLVLTQPEAGTFAAFSATCPHQGCQVKAIAAGTINCFCHGSRFRITDGSVAGGPSPTALPRREIVVTEGHLTLP